MTLIGLTLFILVGWALIKAHRSTLSIPHLLLCCTVTDDLGHTIQLPKPAQRIVSLAPDITENLFAIGVGPNIIGTIKESDYPSSAKSIPRVGDYAGIDLERIISMHPDLIVTWSNTFSRQLNLLKESGIPVYSTAPKHLADVTRTLNNLGCLTGHKRAANQAAAQFSAKLLQLREHYQTQKPVTVFYQIGSYSLITINKDSWINEAIELCGGKNVFADLKLTAPEVSDEAVMVANPQVIVSDAENENWKERWQAWKGVRLYSVNADWISRAGPRLLDGVEQICRDLQDSRVS